MTTTSSDAVKTGRRRFRCPAAMTYVQHGKDILWVGMGAELNRMSPGGWAPGVTHSEEPWPTSRTNLHKLLFSLDAHVNTQVSEVCACCFWTMTPAITVSFKNILELVKPRKTYQGITSSSTCALLLLQVRMWHLWMASHQTPWFWR